MSLENGHCESKVFVGRLKNASRRWFQADHELNVLSTGAHHEKSKSSHLHSNLGSGGLFHRPRKNRNHLNHKGGNYLNHQERYYLHNRCWDSLKQPYRYYFNNSNGTNLNYAVDRQLGPNLVPRPCFYSLLALVTSFWRTSVKMRLVSQRSIQSEVFERQITSNL